MAIPKGWAPLDFGGRFSHLDTHFTDHVGPIYARGEEGARQLGFEVLPHMCNPAGICHGGMLMTVMDVGLAFILHNAIGKHVFTPSVSFNFDFIAPGLMGDFLICEGTCTRHTKSTGFVTGRLTGQDGPVITGSGIMKITDRFEANFGAQSGKTT
jgi:acyl-coenzyme A thioesterase PaaI-like protein